YAPSHTDIYTLSLHDALPICTDGLAEWPAILDTLAERFDVIVPDHPGFGASEAPAWIDDVSDVAYCYLDAIETFGLSGVHVEPRSEEHTSELQSLTNLVCRLL